MDKIKHHKVAALPATLEANAIYFVQSTFDPTYAETYVTDNSGVAKMVGNTTMIDQRIAIALATVNQVEFAPDFATMQATTYPSNVTVFVGDASGDPTVDAGGAYYFYEKTTTTFTKVSEMESLDVVLDWANIQNGPGSTPSQIDQAVANSHTHANIAVLDGLGKDADDCLTLDGNPVMAWTQADW